LEAEIDVSGERLCIMDNVSNPGVPRSRGELKVRLAALETVVDFGIAQLEAGPSTHDDRCIGEYIRVRIDQLEISADDGET
jgi:hypothetical protein